MKSLSRVWHIATLRTVAHQAPPLMGFSRQEYWSGLPFSSPGDLPNPEIKLRSPTLQADYLSSESPGNSVLVGTSLLIRARKTLASFHPWSRAALLLFSQFPGLLFLTLHTHSFIYFKKVGQGGTFLVAQWLRLCLPMQGVWVPMQGVWVDIIYMCYLKNTTN